MNKREPSSIVLTESFAKAMFGQSNPIGKIIRIDNKFNIQVTAFIEDVPGNSSLKFEYLAPFEFKIQNEPDVKESQTRWTTVLSGRSSKFKKGFLWMCFPKKSARYTDKDPYIKIQTLSLYPMGR